MRPSRRSQGIAAGNSDAWDIYVRAQELIAGGAPVAMLTIGDHDWVTDPAILEAMNASATGGNTGYAAMSGTPALRAAIAAQSEAETGIPTAADQVQVTSGGQGALFAAFTTCLDPGDRAAIIAPFYATYPDTVRAASGVLSVLDTRSEDGFEPTRAALEAACAGARALLVNSPHNPTGAIYSDATLAAIAETAQAHDLWVISDEVYATQVFEGRHVSLRSLPGMAERTLVVGSLSKSHAMTGFRIGWLIGPTEIMAAVADLGMATTYGVPGFIQDAALFALDQGDEIAAATAAIYARRRLLALGILSGANGLRILPPKGAMYVFLDIRATGMSGKTFANRLLDEDQIAVMPGESFGAAAAGHVRVALTLEDDRLGDALTRLAAFAARNVRDSTEGEA
ncbi:MAG: aminotransferase class I/II-fold pyridoxal phosphate-dependent enzyme [Pseudomonadota bacterium]